MTDKNDNTTGQDTASIDWNKAMQEYWLPLFTSWSGMVQPPETAEHGPFNKGRVAESLQATVKMWQTMAGTMNGPAALEHFQKATEMTPDIALGFTQNCLQSFTDLQAKAGEWIQKRGANLSTADMQQLDSELIRDLTETYKKEFSKYLKVPQIGLGRVYQERSLKAADKQNTFQLVLSEFLHMLYLPIEKSFKSLQEKMAEMAEAGPLDEKSKIYYNLWIKLLEGHYMELFKQPVYAESMGKTLSALNEFVGARQAVVNDVLKQMSIPAYPDLDELSKEIYLLKKRVRFLEKNNSQVLGLTY
jgi:class III poly(R)-hydroxyalkanoic acid synthase PhaE subunit